ncbi:hypothetical protein [Chromobacterium subtsugae]|uniref:hypothetical protein n=1 Tax=Chromobacterium subtsugae TaxID=251747 RepID=UPI0012FF9EB2|nr:hypothetical protein [Chromobacterium subtsugae]
MEMVNPGFRNQDEVSLNRLHLDTQNPRHDPLEDEDEIIAQLYKDEQVLNLAKDIVAKGTLSPLDRPGVIEMDDNPGHYIVVEGNRRTCALKLLHDPQKAPTPEVRATFEALSKRFEVPSSFSVVVFTDRNAARPWIGLRHLGAQEGAGTRTWDAAQKSRYAETESPNQLALALLDHAEKSGWIDADMREQLAITTLTRYLSSPLVRAALGLGNHRELLYTHDASEVEAALRQFLADAAPVHDGGVPRVHSRSRKLEREAYARELAVRGITPRSLLPFPSQPPEPGWQDDLSPDVVEPAPIHGVDPGPEPLDPGITPPQPEPDPLPPAPDPGKPAQPRPPRGKQHPDDRMYLMPTDFTFTHSDKSLRRLRGEFRSTPIDDHEFAVNYLLRAFIERVLVLYAKHRGVHRSKMADQKLVQVCVEELGKEGVPDNDLKLMRVAMSDENSAHSLHTLGTAVHTSLVATRKSLVGAWDNWEKALKIMLSRM